MCGIVAIIDPLKREIPEALVRAMTEVLHHRGPDGEGSYFAPGVGLGHKRLAIIDLATGQQPMTKDPLTIAYNGEIYNYLELRQELLNAGASFATTSDTEVILELYRKYGADCLRRLRGMFAFVLFDREREEILAARDHFGIKPLYYTELDGRLLFASEIKALLRHPGVVAEVDHQSLQEYLTFQFVLGNDTLFHGIKKVLPGQRHTVDLASGNHRAVTFWEPDFKQDGPYPEDEFVEQVADLLSESVRLQIRSDVPLGAHLSGGLDSSTIALLAARHLPHQLKTFTGGFREGPEFDESSFAALAAQAAGADQFHVWPKEREFVDLLDKLVYHMDEPAGGPGLFPQYMVSRLAADQVKVVLGGQGGDEVFGGYARYTVAYFEQALKGAVYQTNEEGEHIVSLESIIPNLPSLKQYVPMLQSFWRKGVFADMDRRYFRLIDRSGYSLSLYNQDFRREYRSQEVFAKFQRIFNHPDTKSYFNKMTHFDMVASLPALLQVEDRVSMAVSLESRVPMLDVRLVELMTKAPPSLKFRGARLKHPLKEAVAGLVPDPIVQRQDKMGFPVPLHLWRNGPLDELVHDTVLSPSALGRSLFDQNEVRKLIEYEGAFGRRLWGILNLELWLRSCQTAGSTGA